MTYRRSVILRCKCCCQDDSAMDAHGGSGTPLKMRPSEAVSNGNQMRISSKFHRRYSSGRTLRSGFSPKAADVFIRIEKTPFIRRWLQGLFLVGDPEPRMDATAPHMTGWTPPGTANSYPVGRDGRRLNDQLLLVFLCVRTPAVSASSRQNGTHYRLHKAT